MGYPWFVLYDWEPFHIDALGLVTLLGAEEVNTYLGRLVRSRWLEYMPLLGAFMIAGDRFKEKHTSFHMYNITNGIYTSDLSSWFTRWMLTQELQVSRSIVYWEVIPQPRIWWPYHLIAGALSSCFMGFLVALTVLSNDWYGFANAIAMVISIIVRTYILQANRDDIDRTALASLPDSGILKHDVQAWEKKQINLSHGQDKTNGKSEQAKILILLSDANAVTMFIPKNLVVPVFVNNPKPHSEWLYESVRWVAWCAFAVHVIAIGQAKLAVQMYTVALLVIPTMLICWKFGCDDFTWTRKKSSPSSLDVGTPYECWIGSHLKATVFEWPKDVEFYKTDGIWRRDPKKDQKKSTRRQDLYAWLNLTADEEDSMGKWDLLPHKRNHDDTWANDFNAKKELIRTNPTDLRTLKESITEEIDRSRSGAWIYGRKRKMNADEELSKPVAEHADPLEPKTIQRSTTVISTSGVPTSPFTKLQLTINSGSFFTISDEELLRQIRDDFSNELDRLKRAYSVRDLQATLPSTPSPSRILYGTDYDEVNRTLVGVLALRWLHNGQYETFVGTQPASIRLKRDSFAWMRQVFEKGIQSPIDLYTLVTSMVVNDLGKDPQLSSDYHDRTGEDISGVNHDMILFKAVKLGLVQSLDRLPVAHRADIIRGLELGAEFNYGQLAQAENVPACLSALLEMKGQQNALQAHFMEQLLDIAGAAGHIDWTCALKLNEPIYQSYYNVYEVVTAVVSRTLGLRDGYDQILIRRADLLRQTGFRRLEVGTPDDRALMRLLCMSGAADLETAELYDAIWQSLDQATKMSLIHSLNIDGSVAEPAVQPTYMPAMLAAGVGTAQSRSPEQKKRVLESLLRYLARVLTISEQPKEPISVIERSVLATLKQVVEKEEFQANPSILETVPIPEDEVAKMG